MFHEQDIDSYIISQNQIEQSINISISENQYFMGEIKKWNENFPIEKTINKLFLYQKRI